MHGCGHVYVIPLPRLRHDPMHICRALERRVDANVRRVGTIGFNTAVLLGVFESVGPAPDDYATPGAYEAPPVIYAPAPVYYPPALSIGVRIR